MIRIGRESQCLPYAGFFFKPFLSSEYQWKVVGLRLVARFVFRDFIIKSGREMVDWIGKVFCSLFTLHGRSQMKVFQGFKVGSKSGLTAALDWVVFRDTSGRVQGKHKEWSKASRSEAVIYSRIKIN